MNTSGAKQNCFDTVAT